MAETRRCPDCGVPLAPDAPGGLCPACLLKQGLGGLSGSEQQPTELAPSQSASIGLDPPNPAELASYFPQLEILELLGRGGMGFVYKARQSGLDRIVALKIIPPAFSHDPAFAERFGREARSLARLSHPNIVTIFDFGQSGGLYYFLMEYVDGVNLRQAIRAQRLSPKEALAIIPQICDALQYAHDEGIVHRDIKPENILLDRKGRVKIADFGLAKLLARTPTDYTLTAPQHVMGTPHYMAPEQMERPLSVDHRADVYSLGVVFYEMLTGELPIGRFQPPSQKVQVDVRLDQIVLRALEKEPERRYQHASDIKTEVQTIAGSGAAMPQSMPYGQQGTLDPEIESARQQVKGPAIGLLVTGVVNWLGMFILLLFAAPWFAARGAQPENMVARPLIFPILVAGIILVGGSSLIIVGALKMLRLESSPLSLLASILAMIVGPGYLIGWPVGIWSLVVLSRPQVKRAFQRMRAGSNGPRTWNTDPQQPHAAGRGATAPAPSSPPVATHLATGPMLLLLGGSMVISGLCIAAGFVLIYLAFARETPGSGPFWGWMGGALGCIIGGGGALAGTWNTYRQMAGREDLMKSPHWTWLDRTLAGYGFIGAATLAVAFALFDRVGAETRYAMLLLGAMILFQAGLFLAIRAVMMHSARQALRAAAADGFILLPRRRLFLPILLAVSGLAGIAALARYVSDQPWGFGGPVIREARIDWPATDPGVQVFRYFVRGPLDHKATFWIECRKAGQLQPLPGFAATQWMEPPSGSQFEGFVQVSMRDGRSAGAEQAGKSYWTWLIEEKMGRMNTSGWVVDPFASATMRDSSWGHVRQWPITSGETQTVLVLRGDDAKLMGQPGDVRWLGQADAEIYLRMRFDPLPRTALPRPGASGSAADPPAQLPAAPPQTG